MIYAHISEGKIVEVFSPPPNISMATLFHTGLVWIDITNINPQPQPGWNAVNRNGIWVMTPPIAPVVSQADKARDMLLGSVQIQSVNNSLINGIYSINIESRTDIMAQMLSLATNSVFTNGQWTLDWPDVNNRFHTFDTGRFRDFATVIGSYVTVLKGIASGSSDPMPSVPLVIN